MAALVRLRRRPKLRPPLTEEQARAQMRETRERMTRLIGATPRANAELDSLLLEYSQAAHELAFYLPQLMVEDR